MNGHAPANDAEPTGMVLDIQHFSTHDGPGIRTTVFLKGCTLRCKWCCNPESISPQAELGFNARLCIGVEECGLCLQACAEQALLVAAPGKRIRVDWERCSQCGHCVPACPSKALYRFGRVMSVSEVLAEAERDGAFYGESGGGITLSGGECLMQPQFSAALLARARSRGLHTAIETAGHVAWRAMSLVLPHVDTMLHDYKLGDGVAHRRWVGADNARIVANYRRAYEEFPGVEFIARIPLVAGVNDDERHVDAVLDAIEPWPNVVALELLPYHGFGAQKYTGLGRSSAAEGLAAPPAARVGALRAWIASRLAGRAGQASPSSLARCVEHPAAGAFASRP